MVGIHVPPSERSGKETRSGSRQHAESARGRGRCGHIGSARRSCSSRRWGQRIGTSEGGEEIVQGIAGISSRRARKVVRDIADISSWREKLRRGSSSGRRGHIESARRDCEEEVVRGAADISSRRAVVAKKK